MESNTSRCEFTTESVDLSQTNSFSEERNAADFQRWNVRTNCDLSGTSVPSLQIDAPPLRHEVSARHDMPTPSYKDEENHASKLDSRRIKPVQSPDQFANIEDAPLPTVVKLPPVEMEKEVDIHELNHSNISDHLYRTGKRELGKLVIPDNSDRLLGEVDPNFFGADKLSNFVGKDRVSCTTADDKHWDVQKTATGRTAYARLQEPLADGSGYRITEYRSPFRDSQLLGSCYEVDKDGRVKPSSTETLQLDSALRLSRKNLQATVDVNGNLSVTIPGAGRIEEMNRTYHRNGDKTDTYVDGSRGDDSKIEISAKYRAGISGPRFREVSDGRTGEAPNQEKPYFIVTRPIEDGQPSNQEKSVYIYDSMNKNYYCTEGEEKGQRFNISVRNRILVRNRKV